MVTGTLPIRHSSAHAEFGAAHGRIGASRSDMTDIVVTWEKDRERWRRAFREFPGYRNQRRFVAAGALVSVLLAGAVALGGGGIDESDFTALVLCLLPFLMAGAAVISVRRAALRSVTAGTMTWRVNDEGFRSEGDSATEYPWPMVQRWRRAAGHIIVEVRPPAPRLPRPAAAAPLEAFDAETWPQMERILLDHVGAEGALRD